MNPPFGTASLPASTYVGSHFSSCGNDLYAAFVDRAISRVVECGTIGAISSRTGLFLTSFQRWRTEVLLNAVSPTLLADLGQGVLDDAVVETAAYVMAKCSSTTPMVAIALLACTGKDSALVNAIGNCNNGLHGNTTYVVTPKCFGQIPGAPFAYWISSRVQSTFTSFPPFDDERSGRATRCGLGTLDDFRFLRLAWEVTPDLTGWVTYYHGGTFRLFYDEFPLLVRWAHGGSEVKRFVEQKVGSASRKVQGEEKYFSQGFVFPRRTRGFAPKFMPPGVY